MEIEIVVDPEGKVTTKVKGGCGKSCRDATQPIRDALGETVQDRNLPEFYETEKAPERTRTGR